MEYNLKPLFDIEEETDAKLSPTKTDPNSAAAKLAIAVPDEEQAEKVEKPADEKDPCATPMPRESLKRPPTPKPRSCLKVRNPEIIYEHSSETVNIDGPQEDFSETREEQKMASLTDPDGATSVTTSDEDDLTVEQDDFVLRLRSPGLKRKKRYSSKSRKLKKTNRDSNRATMPDSKGKLPTEIKQADTVVKDYQTDTGLTSEEPANEISDKNQISNKAKFPKESIEENVLKTDAIKTKILDDEFTSAKAELEVKSPKAAPIYKSNLSFGKEFISELEAKLYSLKNTLEGNEFSEAIQLDSAFTSRIIKDLKQDIFESSDEETGPKTIAAEAKIELPIINSTQLTDEVDLSKIDIHLAIPDNKISSRITLKEVHDMLKSIELELASYKDENPSSKIQPLSSISEEPTVEIEDSVIVFNNVKPKNDEECEMPNCNIPTVKTFPVKMHTPLNQFEDGEGIKDYSGNPQESSGKIDDSDALLKDTTDSDMVAKPDVSITIEEENDLDEEISEENVAPPPSEIMGNTGDREVELKRECCTTSSFFDNLGVRLTIFCYCLILICVGSTMVTVGLHELFTYTKHKPI